MKSVQSWKKYLILEKSALKFSKIIPVILLSSVFTKRMKTKLLFEKVSLGILEFLKKQ